MRLAAVGSIALALVVGASALDARPQQPAKEFRARVDLLTLEATVLDTDGKPAGDLRPDDFTVTVGGQPRKVLLAEFHGASAETTTAGADAAGRLAPANAVAPDGRIVVFVVDRDSLAPGNELAMLETAATVLDGLGPADAVGLVGVPVGGIDITRQHARVRAALPMMTGTRPRQEMYRDRNITWDEALEYENRNPRVMAEVVARECYAIPTDPGGLTNRCPDDLVLQARELLHTGRAHVQTITSVLDALADRLAPLRGPKHVVLMSGGLPFGLDLLPRFEEFSKKAAEAQMVLYAVHLDQPDSDVASRRAIASAFGGRDMTQGLTTMTGLTGGAFFSAVGRATGVFDRIKTEIHNYYVLGVESLPDDGSGALREVSIKVGRSGLHVRTRSRVATASVARRVAVGADPLKVLLDQPVNIGDVPLTVAAYSTRGTDADTLRVLVALDVGVDASRLPVDWGFVVLNEGNVVATGRQRLELGAAIGTVTTSAKLVPGRYRLRVAARDAAGGAGVADVPLTVGLRVAGDLQMSDLIVGVAEADRLQPRFHIAKGEPLSALIEVLSGDPERLQKARAVIELVPAGSADSVRRILMAARTGSADTVLINAAQIDTAELSAGVYTASVVVLLDDQPVGRVNRVFELVAKP